MKLYGRANDLTTEMLIYRTDRSRKPSSLYFHKTWNGRGNSMNSNCLKRLNSKFCPTRSSLPIQKVSVMTKEHHKREKKLESAAWIDTMALISPAFGKEVSFVVLIQKTKAMSFLEISVGCQIYVFSMLDDDFSHAFSAGIMCWSVNAESALQTENEYIQILCQTCDFFANYLCVLFCLRSPSFIHRMNDACIHLIKLSMLD